MIVALSLRSYREWLDVFQEGRSNQKMIASEVFINLSYDQRSDPHTDHSKAIFNTVFVYIYVHFKR